MRLAYPLVLLAAATSARAQPAPPPPYPAQYAPPAYLPPPHVPLTLEERDLLDQGEISDGARTGGAALNAWLGLGLGQAIQGRYGETGWIFTVGELGTAAGVVFGTLHAYRCFKYEPECRDLRGVYWATLGGLGFMLFRIWSISDALSGPRRHNLRVRELRARIGYSTQLAPYVAPHGGGAVGGLAVAF